MTGHFPNFLSALGTVFVSLMETKLYFPGLPKVSPLPAAFFFYAFKIHLSHCGFKEADFKYKPLACGKESIHYPGCCLPMMLNVCI